MQRLPLANREEELTLFDTMVAGTSDVRILLLEADGGMGKTTLINEFVRHCRAEKMSYVRVDLKGNLGLDEVLAWLCGWLGWQDFPTLTARVQSLACFKHVPREHYDLAALHAFMLEGFTVEELRVFCFYRRPAFGPALEEFTQGIKRSTLVMNLIESCQRHVLLDDLLVGLRDERFELYKKYYQDIYGIEVPAESGETAGAAGAGLGRAELRDALQAADEKDRAARRGALTQALFEDLGAREGRLALLFDTCEQAGPGMGAWLAESFLAHASRAPNLVVVIAGRQVPETSQEWKACCQHHRLGNLRDPGLWQKYAEQIGAAIPSTDWIAGFCDLFDGHPLQMMQALAHYMPGSGGL